MTEFTKADEEIVDAFAELCFVTDTPEDSTVATVGIFFGWIDPEWETPVERFTEAQQAELYRAVRDRLNLFAVRSGLVME